MRTDSYVIAVKVAQRTQGTTHDVTSAAEIGNTLLTALHEVVGFHNNLLVEAEIVVGDTRAEQSNSVGIGEIESKVLEFSRTAALDRLVARGHY